IVLSKLYLVYLVVIIVASHMFVFYFGVLSGFTPPVAITAYTTAGIAGSSPNKTALYSITNGLGGFFIPFILAYNRLLLMQGGDSVQITLAQISAFLSCIFVASALENYLLGTLGSVKRIFMFASAILLVMPGLLGDIAGLAIAIALIIWQKKSASNVSTETQLKSS